MKEEAMGVGNSAIAPISGPQADPTTGAVMSAQNSLRGKYMKRRFKVQEEKTFPAVPKDKETGLPKKYVAGLSPSTAAARAAHWKRADKLSDSDPAAYKPAPGDATAETKPSKHTLAVRKMMGDTNMNETIRKVKGGYRLVSKSGRNLGTYPTKAGVENREREVQYFKHLDEDNGLDKSLATKAKKSGIRLSTLRHVYRRGVAAWNSGHRPGTTPQQWGHARVNSYINKGKTYHTADADLHEAIEYHKQNNISLVENVYRPGSEMFFEVIREAKRLYKFGEYFPESNDEIDILESDLGEFAEYEGRIVPLDFPMNNEMLTEMVVEKFYKIDREEEGLKGGLRKRIFKLNVSGLFARLHDPEERKRVRRDNRNADRYQRILDKVNKNPFVIRESDPTDGHGIGKPFRANGGGAVFVRSGPGKVKKVNFSQSGMEKKYNDPARVKSFVARHHCLTNKDKTSASYWACRWPRYFSDSGQKWW